MLKLDLVRFAIKILGINVYLIPLVRLFSFSINIFLILVLYYITNALYMSIYVPFGIFVLVLLRYLLMLLHLKLDIASRRKLWNYVYKICRKINWQNNNRNSIGHLVTRDIYTIIENIAIIPNIIFYFVCSMLLIATFFYINFILAALLSLSIFIVASKIISKNTTTLAKSIYVSSKKRVDKISLWIKLRSYFVNWKNDFYLEQKINELFVTEIEARNKDSFFKCFDFYMTVFLGAIPVSVALLLEYVFNYKIPFGNIGIYWLFLPIAAFIMEIGRYSYDYNSCQQATEFLKNESTKKSNLPFSPLIIDDSWELWEGTLYDNIIHSKETSGLYYKLLHDLRLTDEFKTIDGKNVFLTFAGNNISSGQRERVLLLRGICLANYFKLPLQIKLSLNSLDPDLCKIVLKLISELTDHVSLNLDDDIYNHLHRQSLRSTKEELSIKYANSQNNFSIHTNLIEKNIKTVDFVSPDSIRTFIKMMTWVSFLFILCTPFVSIMAYLSEMPFNPIHKVVILIILSFIPLLFASCIGVIIEGHCRKLAKMFSLQILYKASFKNEKDILHRLSKDFTMLTERLSWYVHDISWYFAVLVTGLCFLFIQGVVIGTTASLIFVITLMFTGSFFSKINLIQQRSVSGINDAIVGLENYSSLGGIYPYWQILKKKMKDGFIQYRETNIQLLSMKTNFSAIISLLSGLLITSTVSIFYFRQDSLGTTFVLLMSVLFLVDGTIVSLFRAISGFNVHEISYKRMTLFPKIMLSKPILIKRSNGNINIPAINDKHYHLAFNSLKLKEGKMYSLIGKSGLGKTTYLRIISGLMQEKEWQKETEELASEDVPVFYVDEASINLLMKTYDPQQDKEQNINILLNSFIDKAIAEHGILVLDEVLSMLSLQDAQNYSDNIEKLITRTHCCVILVDHRYHSGHKLFIHDLLELSHKELMQ